jgi:hypothetical protein
MESRQYRPTPDQMRQLSHRRMGKGDRFKIKRTRERDDQRAAELERRQEALEEAQQESSERSEQVFQGLADAVRERETFRSLRKAT